MQATVICTHKYGIHYTRTQNILNIHCTTNACTSFSCYYSEEIYSTVILQKASQEQDNSQKLGV